LIVFLLVSRLIRNARILRQAPATNASQAEGTESNHEEVPLNANVEISTNSSGNLPLL